MVAIDFQKAYDSVTFEFLRKALEYVGMPLPYVSVLMSIMEGPIVFCVAQSFVEGVVLQPKSGIRQGDPFSPLLSDVITVVVVYDFQRLKLQAKVLLYADDTLPCIPGSTTACGRFAGTTCSLCKCLGIFQGYG